MRKHYNEAFSRGFATNVFDRTCSNDGYVVTLHLLQGNSGLQDKYHVLL